MRFRTLGPTMRPNVGLRRRQPGLERDGGVGQGASDALLADDRGGRVQLLAPRLDRVVAHGHLEGGLGVAARG